MYSFKNDYSEGALPVVMELLQSSNLEQTVGYGLDPYCEEAKKKIREVLNYETCDIHFLVGGTQANLTVIAAALRPYEAVISADSGHIHVHETGAVEGVGHKVIAVAGKEGKLTAEAVEQVILQHKDEHMVKPAMVYISNATEIGSIYKKKELQKLRSVCDRYGLYLFMDGARLGCALMSKEADVGFADLCSFCDVFYIGGTKNGALFGEAVVIVNEKLKQNFRYMIKRQGGMLAKGRLLGVQFSALFQEGAYQKAARHANQMAQRLQDAFLEKHIPLLLVSPTNQIFPILTKRQLKELSRSYLFETWETIDEEHTAVRFVTSWATREDALSQCIKDIRQL